MVRRGAPWRMLAHDVPPGYTVQQPTQRWLAGGVFEALVDDLRMLLRLAVGHPADRSAVSRDARTLQASPESGARAGFDGHKRHKGSKIHRVVDTLGLLLALHVTPANEQERAQVGLLAQPIQDITDNSLESAFVDQAYTREQAEQAAAELGIQWEVSKLPEAKHGFVLLPRRWVVERSCACLARFRRLVPDYERLPETLLGLPYLAFAILMLTRFVNLVLHAKALCA